ncbi:MAG: hypothetical protein ABWW70_00805 [Thermoproteota archaeon]
MAPSSRSVQLFRRDLEELAARLGLRRELEPIVDKLVDMYAKGLVKINHSALELVVAGYLVKRGYENVDVEHTVPDGMVCDVYAEKAWSSLVVEVETGFTPPSNALDPVDYLRARIVAKVARYGRYASKMALAIPPYYAAPIPSPLLKPPRARRKEDIAALKELVDRYYTSPPIPVDSLWSARLHTIVIVDVDRGTAYETDPEAYYESLGSIVRAYANMNKNFIPGSYNRKAFIRPRTK